MLQALRQLGLNLFSLYHIDFRKAKTIIDQEYLFALRRGKARARKIVQCSALRFPAHTKQLVCFQPKFKNPPCGGFSNLAEDGQSPTVKLLTEFSFGPGLAVLALRRGKARARKLVQCSALRFPTHTKQLVCFQPKFKNPPCGGFSNLAEDGNRTHNLRFTKPLLCQLSYLGIRSYHSIFYALFQ